MDFVRILRSIEEFLYEVMTWIVFYPRTLVRTLVNPITMARYTKLEMAKPKDRQFTEMVSPVLMLILSVLLAHGSEMISKASLPIQPSPMADLMFGTEQGLLATRSIVFSLYALVAALIVMTRSHAPIDRDTLREPLFIECYLVSPFVVLFSVAAILARVPSPGLARAGGIFMGLSILWYLGAQSLAYRNLLGLRPGRAFALAFASFVAVTVLVVAILVVVLGLTDKIFAELQAS